MLVHLEGHGSGERSGMRQSYHEGSWFAVPLPDGGHACGLVARLSPGSKIMLTYLFGPRLAAPPTLAHVAALRPADALKVLRVGDMALASGHWPVLGDLPDWDPARWPMPQFLRRADALKRAWRVTYAETDPTRSEREESVPYDTAGLEADSLYGYGSTELLLSRLLAVTAQPAANPTSTPPAASFSDPGN
jgi:hypothetical protein